MYGLPKPGAGTAEARVCWVLSLVKEDVCVAVCARVVSGALMFVEDEAKCAAFSSVSSRLSMF